MEKLEFQMEIGPWHHSCFKRSLHVMLGFFNASDIGFSPFVKQDMLLYALTISKAKFLPNR